MPIRSRSNYSDPYIKLARLEHAPDEALGLVIPWVRERPRQLADMRGALISLSGPAAPGLLDQVDPERIGRDTVALVEWIEVLSERAVNWTIVPGPTTAWANARASRARRARRRSTSSGRRSPTSAGSTRTDPVAAWRERSDELTRVAKRLTAARLDALRFVGPGTDLTVGLLPGVDWNGGDFQTAWGQTHIPNLPTEEVFTSPDPERTEGVVTSTKPLLVSGRAVNGLRVRFEGGRAVQINADEGAGLLRELVKRDADADRLGEVALVDSSGRIGATGTVFHDTLLDENAASHIAVGLRLHAPDRGRAGSRAHQQERGAHGLHDRRARSRRSRA